MNFQDPSHKKVIGVCFIVFSIFWLGMMFFYDMLMDFIITMSSSDPDFEPEVIWIFDLISNFMWGLVILYHIPRLVIGVALVQGKQWVKIPALVYGVISLINFPLGTILGIYTILVFVAKPEPQDY